MDMLLDTELIISSSHIAKWKSIISFVLGFHEITVILYMINVHHMLKIN